MPSFSDSIFLFILALLLFGPKKLPVLARELGKWIGEFRRASNEFKMQMEDELRQVEQADRQKQIAAMEAAAPVAPIPEPEHPHLPTPEAEASTDSSESSDAEPSLPGSHAAAEAPLAAARPPVPSIPLPGSPMPLPIATSGSLSIMPPATGLPTPRARAGSDTLSADSPATRQSSDPLGSLLDALPEAGGMNGSALADAAGGTNPQSTLATGAAEAAAHGH